MMRYDAIRRRCAQDISADLSKLFLDVIRSLNRTSTSKSRRSQIYLLSDLSTCRRSCPVVVRFPDIFAPFFPQTGLVLGVYETESEDNVVLTPTAIKYNELVNGKLLKNILL